MWLHLPRHDLTTLNTPPLLADEGWAGDDCLIDNILNQHGGRRMMTAHFRPTHDGIIKAVPASYQRPAHWVLSGRLHNCGAQTGCGRAAPLPVRLHLPLLSPRLSAQTQSSVVSGRREVIGGAACFTLRGRCLMPSRAPLAAIAEGGEWRGRG